MILIAVATLPMGGLMVYGLSGSVSSTLDMAQNDLRRTAEVAADGPANLFDNARAMLSAAKADPAIALAGGEACRDGLKALLKGNPQFLTMGVIDRDGTITCHSKTKARRVFSDPSLARRALARSGRDVVVGNFMIGRVTGKPTVAVAAALPPERGGVAFVSLDLERLSATAEGASNHGKLAVTMIQPSSGRMLTHYPSVRVAFGTPLRNNALVDAMRSHPEGGVVETRGVDGRQRIYAFAPVHGAQHAMMLAVGEPREAILAPVLRTARATAILGILAITGALFAAWWAGWVLQIKPVEIVTGFARRLDRDEHEARLTVEAWQSPELRTLAGTLNATAARLEAARRDEERIAASESRFRMLAENTADLVIALDPDGVSTFASAASRDILALEPDDLVGRHVIDGIHPDDRPVVEGMLEQLRLGAAAISTRYRMLHGDGHGVWVEVGGRPLEGGVGSVISIRDITERKRMKDELKKANRALAELAVTDDLTGLLNRRGFDAALERELARCRAEELPLSLLLVDLDRFKSVNDTFGHAAGDSLLIEAGLRIVSSVEGAVVARLGGDEMAVLLIGDGDAADEAAQRIVDRMGAPFEIKDVSVVIGCSIGVCPAEAATSAEIVQRADAALYEAKRQGKGRITSYRTGLLEAAAERHRMETDLRQALSGEQFHLTYQPILSLRSDEIVGYEALLRWEHPEIGLVSPVAFVPVAEESGLIIEIGRWVLEEACRQAASWPNERHVAVNVSAVQFRSPLLLQHVAEALRASGLRADRLEIELTETALVEDGDWIASVLSDIRRLGVRVAMDDFGTGYSSLAHLCKFPLDRIKIDRSFVASAEQDPHALAVTRAVIALGRDIGVPTLAEGVETQAQLDLLRRLGCDGIQGFLIGKPTRFPVLASQRPAPTDRPRLAHARRA